MAATDKKGYIYIQQYTYAKLLADGRFALYRGRHSGRAEGGCTGLEVERYNNAMANPMRFHTIEDIKEYLV